MSKQQQVAALVLPASPNESSEISNLLKKYLYHWPLFVIVVLIMVAAAYFYLTIASPRYPITATLQFTNPTTDDKAAPSSNSLDQLDLVSQPINVEDEINVIGSKKLIYPVVQKLQLWVDYSKKNGLQTTNLYKQSPVYFSFADTNINLSPQGEKVDVIIKDEHSFLADNDSGQQRLYSFSTPIKSSLGICIYI